MSSDPAQAFANVLHNMTCPATDVPPMTDDEMTEALSRLPAPNQAQGSSGRANPPPLDPGRQFAEALEDGLHRSRRVR